MPRKKKTEKVEPLVETPIQKIDLGSKPEESEKFVVVRDDRRVSDNEYTDDKDPKAIEEMQFWKRVCTNWSPQEKVKTVKFNKKKHRNW